MWNNGSVSKDTSGQVRILGGYNAITNEANVDKANDDNGHGTHISSLVLNSELGSAGEYNGVAPDARLVVVRNFDANGNGSYLDVIRGLDWIVANKDVFDIRVLNLSFSATPRSQYWEDPLNQAVMRAWQAGIVVIASAGNGGPDAMSIGVPGNVPYVITVVAMSDNYIHPCRCRRRPTGVFLGGRPHL